MPQIRKFYVFFVLLVAYSTFGKISEIRAMVLLWAGIATLSAARSFFQFWRNLPAIAGAAQQLLRILRRIAHHRLHEPLDDVRRRRDDRALAAGFVSFLLERAALEDRGLVLCGDSACSMVLGFTRSIFLLGFPIGLLYLLWFWHKWLVAAAPVAALLVSSWAPHALRERIDSAFEPHAEMDSNRHRAILRETGSAMIRAHPWLGPRARTSQVSVGSMGPLRHRLGRCRTADYGHLHNIYLAIRGRARPSGPAHVALDDRQNPVGLRAARCGENSR